MPNTLSNFLIGVGLDFKTDDVKKVNSGLDSVKRSALQVAGAVAGAFGAKALTTDINNRTLELTRFSDVFGATAEEVFAMGRVLEREGGTINGFMSQMEGLERLRAGLLTGDVSWIPEGELAGLDTSAIMSASNALEAYQELARQFPTLSPQQRINVAEAIGLDQASILLLSKGIGNLESEFNRIRNIRPIDDEMIGNAQEYNKQWQDLKDNVGGVADAMSKELTPVLNGILKSSNEVFNLWREGFSVGGIIGETSAGGRISAEASFGEDAVWLDTPIGKLIADQIKDQDWLRALIPAGLQFSPSDVLPQTREYSDSELDAMARDMMTRIPSQQTVISPSQASPQPTVITPAQVAPLSAPVRAAQDYTMDRGQSYNPYPASQQTKTRTLQPVTIQVGNQTIKQIVIETMDDEETQTVKDIRSPMVK